MIACNLLILNLASMEYGGSPKMMKGNPSVRMLSERVVLDIYEKHTDVDCTFVFQNGGAKTNVRVGFPDRWNGDTDGPWLFKKFELSVQGVRMKTAVENGQYEWPWHTAIIAFPARSKVTAHVRYRTETGFYGVMGNSDYIGVLYSQYYILHTGASWKGTIGKSEVVVNVKKAGLPRKLRAARVPTRAKHPETDEYILEKIADWPKASRAVVYYQGFAVPKVTGRTLRFVRENFEPTKADDIMLYFDFRK